MKEVSGMTIMEIITAVGITKSQMSRELEIPLRSIEDWASGRRNPPQYLINLIAEHYKLK